jgi:cellulose synthase (UDP-forming)
MSAGYAVRYVPVLVAKGLCPDTLSAFVNQQYRWCAGSMSLMVSPKFHRMPLGLGQRLCFWSGFGYYITTGITAFTALLPPVFLLWLDPTAIHPRNYLWLVPLLLVYPLIVLLHRGAWGFSVLRVSLIYSFAHALAVWDTYRGRTAEWVATGFVSRTPLSTKVIRTMVRWLTLIQVLLWSGIVYDLARHITPVQQIWPLLGFAAFSAWIQLPVLRLAVAESRRVGEPA